jgi:hypothetical protein
MSVSCKFERSLVSHEEQEILRVTYHPAIYEQDADGLKALRVRLRELLDKERTLARENRRPARGKGAPRGGSFPGTAEHPVQRKQVFAPPTGETPSEGMRALPNRRRRTRVPPARIGSVSQATKNAQARRDARNSSV